MFNKITTSMTCAACLLVAASAGYADIVVPTLNSSANLNSFNPDINLVNNAGLSAAVNNGATLAAVQSVTHIFDGGFAQSWVTNASGSDYFAAPNTGFASKPTFVWDLGSAASVDNLVLWNYQNNGGTGTAVGNQASVVNLRFSETTTFSGTPFTYNVSHVVGAGAVNGAQILSLSSIPEARNARYVELTVMDNAVGRTGVTGGGDRAGLGEVRFDTSAAGRAVSDTLVTPVGITQTQGNTLGGFDAVNMINGNGLSATPTVSNFGTVTNAGGPGNTWVTEATGFPNYFNGVNPNPQFEIDLGGLFNLTDMIVWGYGGNANESSDFTLEFSDDGGATFYDSVNLQTGAFLDTHSAALTLGDDFLADFVRLTITDNVQGRNLTGLAGGDRAGLGEIRFLAAPIPQAVPEPSSIAVWSLVATGLFLGYRRKFRRCARA
jgi:hypothetical protein